MSCEYVCDGCGKRKRAQAYANAAGWFKPFDWFQRSDGEGIQDACSRECIKKIAEKSGKTSIVIPI
jgi:hypothetical protein